MTNAVRAAHDALASLLAATYPDTVPARNPGGKEPPEPRTAGGLAAYVALVDDTEPEVIATLCGPVYDLKIEPTVTLAFAGKTRDERQSAAWAAVELLKAALLADRSLAGAADYAEITAPRPIEASATSWLADGLEVGVEILLTAPSRGG